MLDYQREAFVIVTYEQTKRENRMNVNVYVALVVTTGGSGLVPSGGKTGTGEAVPPGGKSGTRGTETEAEGTPAVEPGAQASEHV